MVATVAPYKHSAKFTFFCPLLQAVPQQNNDHRPKQHDYTSYYHQLKIFHVLVKQKNHTFFWNMLHSGYYRQIKKCDIL